MFIIRTNLVGLTSQILHTKLKVIGFLVLDKKISKSFIIYCCGGHLVHVTRTI